MIEDLTTLAGPAIDGTGKITLAAFDGRSYEFKLAIGQLRQLQSDRRKGAYALHKSLIDGSWFVDDLVAILRVGLRGGGMSAEETARVVRDLIEPTPPMELLPTAKIVLSIGLYGPPDDAIGSQTGKETAEKKKTE